jgi:hypothetical protein
MTQAVQKQLNLSPQEGELLDQLIGIFVAYPGAWEKLQQRRHQFIQHNSKAVEPFSTPVDLIRDRLEQSRDQMIADLGVEPFELSVVRNWYGRNFELLDGDKEPVSKGNGRTNPRWWGVVCDAVEGCKVLERVSRNRYVIV